jgi:hypothetical protein
MKARIFVAAAIMLLSLTARAVDKPQPAKTPAAPINKGSYETVEAKVLKVYAFDDDGAKFRAYVVKWKDHEVVVSDPLGTTDKKEGDTIKVMAHRLEMMMGDKKVTMLSFMSLEIPPHIQAGNGPNAVPPF